MKRPIQEPPSRRRGTLLAVALAAVALGWGAIQYGTMQMKRAGGPMANPNDAAQVAKGRTVYAAQCAQCHGQQLEGQPNWQARNPDGTFPAPPHDATGHTWHHPDPVLFAVTKDGGAKGAPPGFKSGMPPFGGTLTDADIWAALAYIKSTWPADIRKKHDQINKAGGHKN